MKYVVINVIEREIYNIGSADTPTEATEIMKNDFMNEFLQCYTEEDFDNRVDHEEKWELGLTEAWITDGYKGNYDWRIIAVD